MVKGEDDLRKEVRNVARKRAKKGKLKRAGVSGFNKPKRTPRHRTKPM